MLKKEITNMKHSEVKEIELFLAHARPTVVERETGISRSTIWKISQGIAKIENLTFENGLKLLKMARSNQLK